MRKVCHWEVGDELAQQGHLLVRHNKGLKRKACNVYRATDNSSSGNEHLVSRGHVRPTSSLNSEKKDSITRTQTIRPAARPLFLL